MVSGKGFVMKKKISFSTKGHPADVGEYVVFRLLPNYQEETIGPFVFLDHLPPVEHSPNDLMKTVNGTGAHPHRGIATLTYVINGESDHYDSAGHHALVHSGGAQWMKAGNGIIHDESFNVDSQSNDLLTHAMQFWINLPSRQKAEPAEYLPIQASDIPKEFLENNSGWIKVIVGSYEGMTSKIPTYSQMLLYHIHVNSGKQFALKTENDLEYALFLPLEETVINDELKEKGELVVFEKSEGDIEIKNSSEVAIDVIVFGGEKYNEPIVFGGPYVMNNHEEIAQAYRDFHAGKYGKIDYELKN